MWYWTKILFFVLVGAVVVWLGYEVLTFPNVSKLKTENPQTTSMIEHRIQEAKDNGTEPKKFMVWQPIEQISPNLQKAVLAGEDARFFEHKGFDWDAINKAWEEAQKQGEKEAKDEGDFNPNDWIPPMPSFKRGASTISQQLAKNLYLSEDRNFLRKGREALITYFLERNLSKKRILEIYLNVIEWGDGIYGAEAASRTYFKKIGFGFDGKRSGLSFGDDSFAAEYFNPKKNPKRVVRRQKVILRGINYIKLQY